VEGDGIGGEEAYGASSEEEYADSEWAVDEQQEGKAALHAGKAVLPRRSMRESLRSFFKGLKKKKKSAW
jgi:hypothetical protein